MSILDTVKPHAALARAVDIDVSQIGQGTVMVDGWDATRMCRGLTVSSEVGEIPIVTLDLTPSVVRAQVMAIVAVDEATHEFLVALGWTPPAAQFEPEAP